VASMGTDKNFEELLRAHEEEYLEERYLRETLADAPVIFHGGRGGGMGDRIVRDHLARWLQPLFAQGVEITPFTSPFRADIIWWKGERVMVVEVGIKVSRDDVKRAVARAELLR
jgi:hypothetical protein